MTLQMLLSDMWVDYCKMNPDAAKIFASLEKEGEEVLNDHIALRTFNHPKLGIASLERQFKEFGYIERGTYVFEEKKLFAKHYEHSDESLPKIFISELLLEKVSPFVRDSLNSIADQVTPLQLASIKFSMMGRPWQMSHSLYSKLAQESEYASWVAAWGFRPNHFTVNVNRLKKYSDLPKLNAFLQKQGHVLNSSGGLIKGTPEDFLEQSSTMASNVPVRFNDGVFSIPGCYYEFALRYKTASGKLYSGFVAKSADKIFESTNRR